MHSEEELKPDPSLEALAARLRALPEPSVPAGLEARLLAAVSTARQAQVSSVAVKDNSDGQAWFALVSTVLALAIVGLLAVFAWQGRGDNGVAVTAAAPPMEHNSVSTADELTGIALSPLDRRMLSGLSAFHWPVEETRPANVSVLRGDLLD